MIEQAGADALELNIYLVATDPEACGADVESRYIELVQAIGESISIPMAVKIGPFFSSLPNMARRLAAGGRRRAGPVQPLPPAGYRPRDP